MSVRISIPIGSRFGRLTIVAFLGNTKYGHREWRCLCDCGNVTQAITSSLRNGNKQSCGCLHAEVLLARNTKHGMVHSPEYKSWQDMKDRCLNPRDGGYARYGGRGVTICAEWLSSFEAFYRDMGSKPTPQYMLERKDNDGDYCKENCIWATRTIQNRNTSKNVFLTFNGETKTAAEWATLVNLSVSALYWRKKQGWTDEQALTTKRRATRT